MESGIFVSQWLCWLAISDIVALGNSPEERARALQYG